MPAIAKMAREKQPGIIVVDRWIPGPYENYLTPEQGIPAQPLGVPWETCMTMGDSWSYIPHENYKSSRKLIHTLCDIVSKGGNLLLNVAPSPEGDYHPEAYERLKEIGEWISVNGEAIYGSHTPKNEVFRDGNIVFTQKGRTVYAIYLAQEGEDMMPEQIAIKYFAPDIDKGVTLLGSDVPLVGKRVGGESLIWLPQQLKEKPPCKFAWVFKFEME
jgi:alpha-L-fucosidase